MTYSKLIEGVECSLFSYSYRGPLGGIHRGWRVVRDDTASVIVNFAETRKRAEAFAADKLRNSR